MSDAWLRGAGRIRARIDGGPLKGGAPRVVWQALDADPRTVSARLAAQRLDELGRASHLVWNPLSGEVVQLIPILRAARSLGWPGGLNPGALPGPAASAIWRPERQAEAETAAGGTATELIAEVNAEGRLCVQIGVVAFPWDPFTSGPMKGLHRILDWLDSWGIPRHWPAGRPATFPGDQAACRNRRLWARGGHFGASQVPDLTEVGPGAVDVELLTGRSDRSRQYAHAGHAAPPGARPPLPAGRDDQNRPASSGIGDLDGYFDDESTAAAAGALSGVG